ncbi:sensor histidine kinase [Tsukamurella paurometabola]|uniref:Sensor histidine kinase n=2 Tax=Tsukamurella paurometabola TaxID=2061 RepID=A0ABS5NA06_TSUPA|nr:sensor histidine kinase [Tsukamurella paurometabola]
MRKLVLGPEGVPYLVDRVEGPPLPGDVLECLAAIEDPRFAVDEEMRASHHTLVPLVLDGGVVGAIAAWTPPGREVDGTDGAVLTILANQTAVALQNASLYQDSATLLKRSEHAYAQARRTAADLAARNAELLLAQRELSAAQRHQVLDDERHRIARELHDSVTQAVLSAGMQIEVCRSDIPAAERTERLDLAKDMTRVAVEQLRSSIFALNNARERPEAGLAAMLDKLSGAHVPDALDVTVEVRGTERELTAQCEHALVRIAGEALFNTAVHSGASRARLRLRYTPESVVLTIDDDGAGEPDRLRASLRANRVRDVDGHGRGLVNMEDRAAECGGRMTIRRSPLGGVGIRVAIPIRGELQ